MGIRELDDNAKITLIAGFETNDRRAELLKQFAAYAPEWYAEETIDWVEVSQRAWPAIEIGERFFLAPLWSGEPTPESRLRVIHNPGLACGTGAHACTQLCLIALEKHVRAGDRVVDVGTGSGVLSIAALRLGAARATGIDTDFAALHAARENFELNGLPPQLVCGSADAAATGCADVTVANISGTVLLAIWEDLLRIARPGGTLIISGFPESEAHVFEDLLPGAEVVVADDWVCFAASVS